MKVERAIVAGSYKKSGRSASAASTHSNFTSDMKMDVKLVYGIENLKTGDHMVAETAWKYLGEAKFNSKKVEVLSIGESILIRFLNNENETVGAFSVTAANVLAIPK